MPSSLVFAVVITVSAFVAALVGLMALAIFDDWRRARGFRGAQAGRHEPYVFLFDGRDLIDASPPARVLLRHLPGGPDDWIRLIAFLSPRFAGLSDALDTAPGAGG
ncbi:MAG: diguanylate cyclase, partial [Rhodobacteraceae bacterium]|nr:diguanylate cyclase [Paracoccaceae bacterium]